MINKKKGFTLIELLIAVTIIGMLLGIGTFSFSNIQRNARDTRRRSDLKALQNAVEQFYARTGIYPTTNGIWWSSEPGDVQPNGNANDGNWVPGLVAGGFISQLPRDPLGRITDNAACIAIDPDFRRAYMYNSNGLDYKIVSNCAPETPAGTWPVTDPFFDVLRPNHAWAVWSSERSRGW